jgi:hypothetical protein
MAVRTTTMAVRATTMAATETTMSVGATTVAGGETTMTTVGSPTSASTSMVNHGVLTKAQSVSPALIAGITAGSIAAVVLLVCLVVFCRRRKRLADFEAHTSGTPSNIDDFPASPGSTPEQANDGSTSADGYRENFDAKPTVQDYPVWWDAKSPVRIHPTPHDGSSYAPAASLRRLDTGSSASSDGIIVAPALETTDLSRNIPPQSAKYDLSYSSLSSQSQVLGMQRHQPDQRRPYP